jgi:hypothetical protein
MAPERIAAKATTLVERALPDIAGIIEDEKAPAAARVGAFGQIRALSGLGDKDRDRAASATGSCSTSCWPRAPRPSRRSPWSAPPCPITPGVMGGARTTGRGRGRREPPDDLPVPDHRLHGDGGVRGRRARQGRVMP